ncbi:GNAT family N-acetyltransferase [Kineococcus terrestris]|uniref:GNAT family N-acetyltransferase n=1 Tax=Kineococcus terrestris TaxID=2044856 RepID=UPI0034DB3057
MSAAGTGGGTGDGHAAVRRVHAVGDVSGLRALVLDHVRFEGSGAVVPDDWADRVDAHLRAGRLRVFVAEVRDRVVGYASLTDELSTWTGQGYAHLDCLYLHEAHRGRGTGRRLVAAAVDDAHRRGLGQVQWQTPAWNRSATAFYERLGATRTAKERFTLALPVVGARA